MRRIDLSVLSTINAFAVEVRQAIDQLTADGATRFVAVDEVNSHGEARTTFGARQQGSEYLPASFSDWLYDQTVLIQRRCHECKAHPSGTCDICAVEREIL